LKFQRQIVNIGLSIPNNLRNLKNPENTATRLFYYYYYYYYYYSKVLSILKYSLNDAAVQTNSIEKVTNYEFQTEKSPRIQAFCEMAGLL